MRIKYFRKKIKFKSLLKIFFYLTQFLTKLLFYNVLSSNIPFLNVNSRFLTPNFSTVVRQFNYYIFLMSTLINYNKISQFHLKFYDDFFKNLHFLLNL